MVCEAGKSPMTRKENADHSSGRKNGKNKCNHFKGRLRDTVKTHVGVISCARLWCSFMKSEEMTLMTSLEKQILHCGSWSWTVEPLCAQGALIPLHTKSKAARSVQTAAVYCDKEAAHLRRPDPSCNDCLRQEWLRETVKLYPPLGVLAILKQNVKHTHSGHFIRYTCSPSG